MQHQVPNPLPPFTLHKHRRIRTGLLGISGVTLFAIAFIVFGNLHPNFSFVYDYVSLLGAQGEPLAFWWNAIGFGCVGVLFMGFGWSYGQFLGDRLAGILLALFGLGFGATAIPVDLANSATPFSKAHIVAICLGLACWLFGLARISANARLSFQVRFRANATALFIIMTIIGSVLDVWVMPITHRLVFLGVFGWTGLTAVQLLVTKKT